MNPLILQQGVIKQAGEGQINPKILDFSQAPERFRAITVSSDLPTDEQGEDGDIWFQIKDEN